LKQPEFKHTVVIPPSRHTYLRPSICSLFLFIENQAVFVVIPEIGGTATKIILKTKPFILLYQWIRNVEDIVTR